jgi:polyisoprenoid-binding protein YceI
MRSKLYCVPIVLAAGYATLIAIHPGVAYAEPRLAGEKPAPFVQNATYDIDVMHGDVSFEIMHLGLSTVRGRFNKFSGKVVEDPTDLTKSSVEFTAEVESIDTAVAARDTHLKSADFFEVAKYPTIAFKSTKVDKKGDGYVVTGDLTMKGKTKQISIPFRHYGPLKLDVGDMSTRIGVIAEPIVLKRSDFGIGGDFKLPGGVEGASDNVTVRISFEGILKK